MYAVGDHGAIIVAAPFQKATKEFYYSLNQGLTWNSVQISETPAFVNRIEVDDRSTTRKFLIFTCAKAIGQDERCDWYHDCKMEKGVVVTIDFDKLNLRTCRNPENPDDPNSDYETWSLNSEQHGKGQNAKFYVRRKIDSQCFHPIQFNPLQQVSRRECTERDWECDDGYERGKDGSCKKIEGSSHPESKCIEGLYEIKHGYRKVKGAICAGGVDYRPTKLPCTIEKRQTLQSHRTMEPQDNSTQIDPNKTLPSNHTLPRPTEESTYQVPHFVAKSFSYEAFVCLTFLGGLVLVYYFG